MRSSTRCGRRWARRCPQRASAGWSKAVHAVTAGLRRDGGRYVMYQWAGAPAGGGVEGRDGFHLIGHLITLGGLTLPNLETYEQLYPVRFHRQELRCDSAGPGRFRGGAGCDYEVEIFTPADYAFRGEGVGAPSSFGAAGGRAGAGGEVILTLADGKTHPGAEIRRRAATDPATYRALSPGRRRLWRAARTRDPGRVLRDVRDGVVSAAAAERDYGVAIAGDGRSIDETRTATLRAAAARWNVYGSCLAGGRASRAGRNSRVTRSSQPSEIISSRPMLAVPGWLDSHKAPNAVAVVSALKTTARIRLDCSIAVSPARQASTK